MQTQTSGQSLEGITGRYVSMKEGVTLPVRKLALIWTPEQSTAMAQTVAPSVRAGSFDHTKLGFSYTILWSR